MTRDTPEFLNDAEIHRGSAPKPVETEKHIRWVGDVLWIGDLMFAKIPTHFSAFRIWVLDLECLELLDSEQTCQDSKMAMMICETMATNFVRAAALAGMVKA